MLRPDPVDNANGKPRAQMAAGLVRFGPYEIDRQTGEVRKFGVKLKLSGQPLEVLLLLLERAGELVTREELKQRLWPQDVFVDFERSLNSAVKKLRGALHDSPDDPRYIETHPRKGYRFIGQTEEVAAAGDLTGEFLGNEGTEPVREGRRTESVQDAVATAPSHFVRWLAAGLAVLIIAVASFLVLRGRGSGAASVAPVSKRPNVRSSIAILGFKNLSSLSDQDWLGTAFVQMLATELQSGGKLRIIPDEVVARAKLDLGLKEKDGYPRDTLRALHKDLASDYVVAGSYVALGSKESGQVRLDLRLQETISGETLASIAVSGKQSEIFDLVGQAGREMRAKVGGTIGPEGDVDWRAVFPSNPDAARLYGRGLDRLRVADNISASDLLQQSLAIEPQFALGHAALAQAWESLGYDGRAQASAQKALSLAASLPENVRLRVEGQYYELQHDWAGAIPAYHHLFQDYPDDLEAGLKLAETQTLAGELREASSTLSSLRSLPEAYRQDPRVDLLDASVAAHNSDYKAQQALATEAAKKADSVGSRVLLAHARMIEGWALDDQGKLEDALQAYRAAQRIFEDTGDSDSTATVLNNVGIVLQKQGDLSGATEKLEEAQKRFRQVGDQNGLGSALTNLGEVYRAKGDLTPAEDFYREALDIFHKTSRKENEYATLNNLGGLLYERGDFRGARKIFENLLRLRQEAGDKSGVGFAKTNLADALRVQGELERAGSLHEEALRIFRDIGDRATSAAVETSYAKVLMLKNDLQGARRVLSDALKINQEIGARGDAAFTRILLFQVALSEGHPEQVDEGALASSIEELRTEQRSGDEMEALAIQIQALLASGKVEPAQQSLVRAQSLTNTTWLARFHLAIAAARIDAARGKIATSRQKIKAAQAQAEKAGCRTCETESLLTMPKVTVGVGAKILPAREGQRWLPQRRRS